MTEDHLSLLMKFGLSNTEAMVYLSAVGLTEGSAREISIACGKERSQTYHCLVKLQQLGLIDTTLGSPAKFRPVSLNDAIDRLYSFQSEKLQTLDKARKILARSPAPHLRSSEIDSYSIVKGRVNTYLKMIDATKESNTEVLILLSSNGLIRLRRFSDFLKVVSSKSRKGVRFRMISEITRDNLREARVFAKCCELRHMKNQFTNGSIYDKNKASIALSLNESLDINTQEHVALWTNAKSFMESLINYFDSVWIVAESFDSRVRSLEAIV